MTNSLKRIKEIEHVLSRCKIPNCDRKSKTLGYCGNHYSKRQWRQKRGLAFDDVSLMFNFKSRTVGAKNVNWKGGVAEYPNHYKMKKLRLEKLKKTNYTCEICGKPTKSIHHRDKSKDNHSLPNFIAVCPKCHYGVFHKDVVGRKPKFTEGQKRAIRNLRLTWGRRMSASAIAKDFGCTPTTIYNILKD